MKVHTRRGRAGFSLTEMLVVVGIIAILLGIGVPSILYYQRELKLTELDDNARSVFVAAQNHLTALRSASAGELEVSAAAGREAKSVPDEVETVAGTELMYVSTHVTGAKPGWLVLPGSIESDLAEGSYLVEFEPKSGSVYGVFFLEQGGRVLDESTYEDVYQYSDGGKTCRVREGRKAFSKSAGGFYVGYYGADGELDMDRPDAQTLPKPRLTLINAEELVLKIAPEGTVTSGKVYASVSVSDGSASKTLIEEGRIQAGEVSLVLDTLDTAKYSQNKTTNTWNNVGGSFAQWMKDETSGSYVITPGADITVTVSIFYKPDAGEGVVALPQSASVTTNSLFAARTGNTAQVAYGRHLQNLSTATSHLDSAITAAEQVREIDFGKAGERPYSWSVTYSGRKFNSISNSNLSSYNGQGQTIANMDATAVPYAGLFSSATGMTLEHIVMVNAKVNGMGSAGALAGIAQNTKVENCQVYLNASYNGATRIKSNGTAAGLIGLANGNVSIDSSFASTVIEGGTVGGLVGRGRGITVQNSYAASHLLGNQVGGLVGGLESNDALATIQNSYAAGTIARATAEAAGLLVPHPGTTAVTNRITVRNSYAAVDYGESVPASDKVYGAVPVGSCTNVSYLAKAGVNDAVTVPNVTAVNSTETMGTCAALGLGTQFTDGNKASAKAYPYNLPVDGAARDPQLAAPYPYPTLNVGVSPNKVPVPHYGDWLVAQPPSVFLAYFEQYAQDGTYGYQYPTATGEENTLRDDKGALRNEGYALISKEDPREVKVAGADAGWTKHTDTYTDSLGETYNIYILATDLAQKRHTQTPARYTNASDMPADYGGYCELTVDGNTLWFNPDFAKTTSLTKPAVAARENESIRSIRHFNNMRRYSSDKPDYWTQELDLDGALYEGYQADGAVAGMAVATAADGSRHMVMDTITMVSSTALKDSWGAEYDGGGHAIRHMDIKPVTGVGSKADDQGRTYAGLFGRTINAGVKDLTVENCSVTGEKLGGKDAYTGVLVAYNEGTVENCCAVNCTVSATEGYVGGLLGIARTGTVTSCGVRANSASDYDRYTVSGGTYTGGFAGYESDGVIEHCYAAVKVSGENAGGFAGRLEGAGSIRNSYAGGHTVNGAYSAGAPNVSATKLAGGFAGKRHATKLVTLENVYTTCSVGVPKGKTADVFAPEVDQTPGGFAYAGGDVFVDGKAGKTADHNKAKVGFRPSYSGVKAVAHPYDETLSTKYYYQPVTRADGTLMDHYGDWCESKDAGGKREWEQQLVEGTNKGDPDDVVTTIEQEPESGKIHVQFDLKNTGQGWKPDRLGPDGDGTICISTDLGYMLIFRVIAGESPQEFIVIGGSGAENTTFKLRYLDKDGNEVSAEDAGNINAYEKVVLDLYIDPSELPPYHDHIRVGAVENDYYAELPMPEGGVPEKDLEGTISVDDSSFDDWSGYKHQVYEGFPGNQGTPLYGHRTVAMLGDENKIYIHVIEENDGEIYSNRSINEFLNFDTMYLTTKDGAVKEFTEWWRLNGYTQRIEGYGDNITVLEEGWGLTSPAKDAYGDYRYRWHEELYDTSIWPNVKVGEYDVVRWFLRVEEGRMEYEVEIDLDALAKNYLNLPNGDVITNVKMKFRTSESEVGGGYKWLEVDNEKRRTS